MRRTGRTPPVAPESQFIPGRPGEFHAAHSQAQLAIGALDGFDIADFADRREKSIQLGGEPAAIRFQAGIEITVVAQVHPLFDFLFGIHERGELR